MIFDTIDGAEDFNVDDDWGFFWFQPIDDIHVKMNYALNELIGYNEDVIKRATINALFDTQAWAELYTDQAA